MAIERNGKEILVCDCEGTMALNGKALAKACGGSDPNVNRQLCRMQIEEFERIAGAGKPLVVACTQEAPIFMESLAEMENAPDVRFTNIRERAGWSLEGDKANPKIAALLAEAALDLKPATAVTMKSEGVLLVIGGDEYAIEAAKQAASRLDVTVLLTANGKASADVPPPRLMDVPVFTGQVKEARGHLGAFEVSVEGFAPTLPSSREGLKFGENRSAGVSQCDLILDLRGGTPLFSAPEARDGYFNPDPGNPALVQKALFDLVDLVGEFDKPRYVDFDASLCAHSRSNITGCTACLDVCPAGAIAPDGDTVAIDPFVCGGCGACASVCPTGAAMYALPADDGLYERARTLLSTYREAGGKDPVLLVHDMEFGEVAIDIMARMGRGLPARVIPFAVNQVSQIGLDFLLAATSYGAAHILLLQSPAKAEDGAHLAGQVELAGTILAGLGYGDGRIAVVEEADPTALEDRLYGLDAMPDIAVNDFAPMGRKRSLMSLALYRLHETAPKPVEVMDLPAGAPFGTLDVNVEGCTVCLACIGTCPTGALKDNPDKPQVRFQEDVCVQCGLCRATCPEKVIDLVPRLNFAKDAQEYQIIKEEEPFQCVRCGKPFGTQSSIERMVDKLAGHSMFEDEGRLDLIKMCDDCRVIAQAESAEHPFAGPPRPLTRTTEDYLRERDELRKVAADAEAAREAEKKDKS